MDEGAFPENYFLSAARCTQHFCWCIQHLRWKARNTPGLIFKKNAWLSLSRYSVSPFQFLLPHTHNYLLLLPQSHFRILLVSSRTSLSPTNSSSPFSYSATNHCCREEELAVKRLQGALRRFPWRATPPSTVEGASSASTVEVSTTVLCFCHCCRCREALSRLRINAYESLDP